MQPELVACYTRVSTDSKDQANSLENQQSYFNRVLGENPKYQLTQIYADKGLTGTRLHKREAFEKMLYDAGLDKKIITSKKVSYYPSNRKPLFTRIFVKNTSRFARNTMVIDIIRELRVKGVYVNFLDINITSEDENYEFMLTFFLNFDQQESIDRSKKVRFGHAESAINGNVFTNNKIYGYKYISDTNSLETIEEEAKVIKKIFELYANGYGIRRILNYLEENNITTREKKPFAKSTISKILQNEKYCGVLVRNKYDTGIVLKNKSYPKVRPQNEWIVHRDSDKVPAIIDEELFYKCQELKSKKVNTQNQVGIYHGIGEFVGLIRCGKCGNTYTKNADRGRVFYNCGLKKSKGTNVCNNKNLSASYIEQIIERLQNIFLPDFYRYNQGKKIKQLNDYKSLLLKQINDNSSTSDEINSKKIELEGILDKKNKLADLYIEGKFDKEYLDQKREELDFQITKLQDEIFVLSQGYTKIIEQINQTDRQISKLEQNKNITFTREETLKEISYIYVCDGYVFVGVKIFNYLNKALKDIPFLCWFTRDSKYQVSCGPVSGQEVANIIATYPQLTDIVS